MTSAFTKHQIPGTSYQLPPMHFLFLSATFADADHPAQGSYNVALCRALAVEHAVTAVSPRAWPSVLRSAMARWPFTASPACEAAQIECHYPAFWYSPGFLHAHHGTAMWRSVRRTVQRVQETRPIDAVLSYWAHPDGEAGLRAAQSIGVPHAVIVGGSDVLLMSQQQDRRQAVQRVLRESDAVITVSDGLREAVIAQGVPPERVHTIYQGVDVEHYHPGNCGDARQRLGLPADRVLLLWVGRMVEVKRLDVLIAACAKLRETGLNFELCLAGDGPLRPVIEQLVQQAGLTEHVRFLGSVRHEELPDWYRAADATVLSSRSEGLPNVLRESLACGTPFASTDVGSIAEISDPMWSRLAPANDADALAKAITGVLNPDCKAAAAKYRARTWSACATEVVHLFEQLRGARADVSRNWQKPDRSGERTGQPEEQLVFTGSTL